MDSFVLKLPPALFVITSISKLETFQIGAPRRMALYIFRSMGINRNWFLKVFVCADRVYGHKAVDLV